MEKLIRQLISLVLVCHIVLSAPTRNSEESRRQQKSLAYFDYIQPDIDYNNYNNYESDVNDYASVDLEENDLSRTIPSTRKRIAAPYNSPIYYIRLPPQPYMFIPGLGYVSQPPPTHAMSQFVNLPVSFISNGKPTGIYQWNGALGNFPLPEAPPAPAIPVAPPKPRPQRPKPADSTIHRLPGQYAFNGKPEDIYVLRDSYNSLYSDALQNFYP